jgi:hypothetical protein
MPPKKRLCFDSAAKDREKKRQQRANEEALIREREQRQLTRQNEEVRAPERKRDREQLFLARQNEEVRVRERNGEQSRREQQRANCRNLAALNLHDDNQIELCDIGSMTVSCQFCGALHFPTESMTWCCHKGIVKLDPLRVPEFF